MLSERERKALERYRSREFHYADIECDRQALALAMLRLYPPGWDEPVTPESLVEIGGRQEEKLSPEKKTLRGKTTLCGVCQRVGGVRKKTAHIRLLSGEIKAVQLKSRELAQQLGIRLYQMVGLEGEGIWNSETLDLQEFRADSLSPYRDRSDSGELFTISDSLKALSDASGNRWDNVSPDEYIEELRHD